MSFIENHPKYPYAFIQWKGTDVCMDFHCECGEHHHIDAMFVYNVKCHKCGVVWEIPCYLIPRKNPNQNEDSCVFHTTSDQEE